MAASVKHLDQDGATQLTAYTWPDAFAGQAQRSRKSGIENNGDRVLTGVTIAREAVGANDGWTMRRMAADTVTLSAPYGVTAVVGAAGVGGVWGSTGTRYYRVTGYKGDGETIGSTEVSVNVDVVTKKVTLNWTELPGADGYVVYRSTVQGVYTTPALLTTIIGSGTTTYLDDGTAAGVGALPSVNTTGGWFLTATLTGAGAGGVWSGTGPEYFRVVAVDSAGVELATTLEAAITVDVVTKKVNLAWDEYTGAAGYKVYRSTTSETYSTPALRATVTPGTTLVYVDDGAAVSAGAPTNGPSYGIPPTLGLDPVAFGDLAVGQQVWYWTGRVVGTATSEIGNDRLSLRRVTET